MCTSAPCPLQIITNGSSDGKGKIPYGIALLVSNTPTKIYDKIQLSKKQTQIPLTEELLKLIQEGPTDLVVVGTEKSSDRCSIFEQPQPGFVNPIRLNVNLPNKDLSWNRCTDERHGFVPELFKIGKKSPVAHNICDGTRFLMDGHLVGDIPEFPPVKVTPDLYGDILTEGPTEENSCNPSIEARKTLDKVTRKAAQKVLQKQIQASTKTSCPPDKSDLNQGDKEVSLHIADVKKRKLNPYGNNDDEWMNSNQFKDEWLQSIDRYQSDLLSVNVIKRPEVRQWFENLKQRAIQDYQPRDAKFAANTKAW